MLRSLSALVMSRRGRTIVAVGLAGVMAVTGGWMLGSDDSETKVAAGSNDAPPPLTETTMPLFPGDEAVAADPSSTTTNPHVSSSTSPSGGSRPVPSSTTTATNPGVAVAVVDETTTSSTTTTTIPATTSTTLPPYGSNCGAPLGPASEPGPKAAGWRMIPAAPIAARLRHGAVWTGREVIVWGGWSGAFTGNSRFNDGAAYDPATGTWRVLPSAPLEGREVPAMVWTGREVVVVGSGTLDGAAYDPAKNCWRRIAHSSLGDAALSMTSFGALPVTWNGSRVLVWNGVEVAAWDPVTDTWERFPGPPADNRCVKSGRWAGHRLVVWWASNSATCSQESPTGALFDLTTRTWTPTVVPEDFALSDGIAAPIWTGREVLVPGYLVEESRTSWFAFHSDTATWRAVAQPSYWEPWQSAVWSGSEMILWGGIQGGPSNTYAYDPGRDQWREAARSPFEGRNGHSAVWTGTEMIIWGGQGSTVSSCAGGQEFKKAYCDGGAYRP